MNFDWQALLLVGGIIAGIMFFVGRPRVTADGAKANEPVDDGGAEIAAGLDDERLSGPELMERIQNVLGVGIFVESVELGEPVTIRATFLSGQHQTQTTVSGASEHEAWQQLAKAAVAWRRSDFQHLPMWWGSGG